MPLAPLTTFGIGGPARFFVRVKNIEELKQSLDYARDQNLATLILGGGSNVLFGDDGFDGLVIKIEIVGVEQEGNVLIAGAGESWDALVARAVSDGLWGVENLSGIPGTVGGATVGSIGAYGQAISQTVMWVEALDRASGEIKKFTAAECNFGYRQSVFSGGGYVVVRAAFSLNPQGIPTTSYKDLAHSGSLTMVQIRQKVLAIRATKFPDLSIEGTAGSFFKNPIVSMAEAVALQRTYPAMPTFAMPETAGVKVPLAWLLDHVLRLKGTSVGGARLFEKQPLVIAAKKNSLARDVELLAQFVEKKVKENFNIKLEREVKVIF